MRKCKCLSMVINISVVALIAIVLLSGCNRSALRADNTTSSVKLSDFFKSTDWVDQHANDAKFVLVDTRPETDYKKGHIPGAINIPRTIFNYSRNVINPQNGKYKIDSHGQPVKIACDIPSPAELIDILTYHAITPDTTVVAYDNDTSPHAGRFAWVLKAYGHSAAYVMNGGIDKWKDADGKALSTTAAIKTPGVKPYKIAGYFNNRITKSDLMAVIETADDNAIKAGYVISDVRTPSEYTGFSTSITSGTPSTGRWTINNTPFIHSVNEGARPGHIPHSRFSDYESAVYTDYINPGTGQPVVSTFQQKRNVKILKSEAELKAHFTRLGITPDKTVYNYCEGGNRSGVYTLILLGLGYPSVYNYDGSWNEWSIQGADYPVETGDRRINP